MTRIPCIDVSCWQGTINWQKVKAAGHKAAVIRAGYGRNNIDSKWAENVRNAAAAGLDIGAYWFSYALTPEDARKEADYLCDAVEAAGLDFLYPLAYDYEYASVDYAKEKGGATDKTTMLSLAKAFLAEIEARGYYAVNYTNLDFMGRGFQELTMYDTWLADWSDNPRRNCGLWQYSSKGSVPGIVGSVDMDKALYDYPSIITAMRAAAGDRQEQGMQPAGVTADDVLAVMISWIGKSRSLGTHRDIIDLYNTQDPLPVGYRVQYDDSYCDTGLTAAFLKLDALDLIGGGECGVERHVKLFQAAGIWEEDGTIRPNRGDIIVYNWDTASQPNDGFADHIGLVENVAGGYIYTVECNMNGGFVGRRKISVGNGYIRGFAHPKYAGTERQSVEPVAPSPYTYGKASETTSNIKIGAVHDGVKAIQDALNHLGYGNSGTEGCDGEFGTKTDEAVRAFQMDHGIEEDGIVGNETRGVFAELGY